MMMKELKSRLNKCEEEKESMYRLVLRDSQVIEELSKRMNEYEQPKQHLEQKSNNDMGVLKLMRKRYEDDLERKDEQIKLVISCMLEIRSCMLQLKGT